MKASIKDFEIMAPVGSRESLAAAIQAGADSIYFGIESLNMRARSASTFTVNDLREIAQICDKHGIKSYLTINTIIYDEDIALMRTIVDAAKEAGISAVIAADVAVMAYCCEVGQEVHLSTQLNISNAGALKFYARFADVVVLARELNLKQVRVIYDTIQKEQIKGPNGELVRIEMFCPLAMRYSAYFFKKVVFPAPKKPVIKSIFTIATASLLPIRLFSFKNFCQNCIKYRIHYIVGQILFPAPYRNFLLKF